jgi:AraC-like DNA-binding protein
MVRLAFFCHLLPMQKCEAEFLGCGELLPNPCWRMRPHSHPHHELIVIKSGAMLLKTRHGELVARSGDILFYQAGLIHEEISQPDDPVGSYFLSFSARIKLPDLPLRLRDSEGRIVELFRWIHRDLREHRPEGDCLALLETIIRELHWLLARPKDDWLEHVREHLQSRFTDPLSLDDVARHAGMSRFAFVRKFKRLCGRTPMEELRQIRLHEARNLILSCDLPMKMIAFKVGIGDEYQLSKLFRRYFGIAPRDMRNSKTTRHEDPASPK